VVRWYSAHPSRYRRASTFTPSSSAVQSTLFHVRSSRAPRRKGRKAFGPPWYTDCGQARRRKWATITTSTAVPWLCAPNAATRTPSHIEMRTSWDEWVRVTLARGSTMTPVSEDEADEFWRARIAPKPPGEGEDRDLDASWENGVFRAFERHLIRSSSKRSAS